VPPSESKCWLLPETLGRNHVPNHKVTLDYEAPLKVRYQSLDEVMADQNSRMSANLDQYLEEGTKVDYEALQFMAHEFYHYAKAKGFGLRSRKSRESRIPERLLMMIGEVSETMEEYRNGHSPTEVYYKDGKPEGIPIELADVLMRLLCFCGEHDIDIAAAVKEKHRYNLTRPFKHGGKRC